MNEWHLVKALIESTEEMIDRIGDSGLSETSLIERINSNIRLLDELGIDHDLEVQ